MFIFNYFPYLLSFTGIFFVFLYYALRRKKVFSQIEEQENQKKKLTFTREQILSMEGRCTEKPINFFDIRDLFKPSENCGPINPIFKNKKIERKKQRVKGLSKGNEILFQDDLVEEQKDISDDLNKKEEILTAKEKKNLDILLSFMIKKSRMDHKRERRQYDLQEYIGSRNKRKDNRSNQPGIVTRRAEKEENEKIFRDLIRVNNIESFIICIEALCKLKDEKIPISKPNYHKFALLSIRFELLEWAAFLLREMHQLSIEVTREILDEFLHLNYVVKTMKNLVNLSDEELELEFGVVPKRNAEEPKESSLSRSPLASVLASISFDPAWEKYFEENLKQGKEEPIKLKKIRKIWKRLNLNSETFEPQKSLIELKADINGINGEQKKCNIISNDRAEADKSTLKEKTEEFFPVKGKNLRNIDLKNVREYIPQSKINLLK